MQGDTLPSPDSDFAPCSPSQASSSSSSAAAVGPASYQRVPAQRRRSSRGEPGLTALQGVSPFLTLSAGEQGGPSHSPEVQRDLDLRAKGILCPSDTSGSSATRTGHSAEELLDLTCVVTRREHAAGAAACPSLVVSAAFTPEVDPEPFHGGPTAPASAAASSSPPPFGSSSTPWPLPPLSSDVGATLAPLQISTGDPMTLPSSGGGAVPPPLPALPASPQQPERGSSTLAPRPMQVM